MQAGDVIGTYAAPPSVFLCARSATGYVVHQGPFGNDVAVGTTDPFTPMNDQQLGVSATLEPDTDSDGFGDETQDNCVGTAGTFDGCPTTVTVDKLKQKGAKPKVKATVTVPGRGTLKAGSPTDPTLAAAAANSVKSVTQTLTANTKQQLTLTLKLTKSAARKLAGKGKLKLQVKVVYTPTGGPAGSQTGKVKLKS